MMDGSKLPKAMSTGRTASAFLARGSNWMAIAITLLPTAMRSGGVQEIEGSHYYFSLDTNEMATGWKAIDGSWYWFDEATGKMAVNQALTNGRWSRFDAQGKWLGYSNGWVLDGDDWYWTSNGAPQKGWLWAGGSWY